ncbi:hypothetical protein KDK95_33000 [Actinospica sp. MGRD01-02]|uniref:Uncharacterized protein n=1 Tax=Actinospica acidithermotolerans TaxID=2828514 RepID=A0A941EH31_9ACTN|nr:hypothetical protein [Actinospica acidithermotolerans]MBR7831171.1 hypothetical protein [Actinospica acidithermotolerans]
MTSDSGRPSADANIDALQAWAAGSDSSSGAGNGARRGAGNKPERRRSTAFFSVPGPGRRSPDRSAGSEKSAYGFRGNSLIPKVLLVVAAGLAAYIVFSFIISLLMMILMIAGGVALLYGVYRFGRWHGRRD